MDHISRQVERGIRAEVGRDARAATDTAAAPPRVGRPRSEEADKAIIEATLDILSDQGIAGLTIESVAARARVGRPTIYRRWPSKLRLVMSAVATLPELHLPDTGSLRGDLRQLASDTLAIMRSSALGRVLPHVFTERSDAALDDALARFVAKRNEPWVAAIQRGISRGELPPATPPETVQALIGGALLNQFWLGRKMLDAAFVDDTIAIVLAGLWHCSLRRTTIAKRPRKQPKPAR